VPKIQLQLISNLIISKPKSHVKATPTCLQMPIIQKKWAIKYINSKPPLLIQN
jgi:hypothetical protein